MPSVFLFQLPMPSALLAFRCCSLVSMAPWREFELISSVSTWILYVYIFATPNAGSRGCLPGAPSPHPIIEGCSSQPLAFKVLQAGTRHSLYVHVFVHAPNTWWHLVSLKCSSRCLLPPTICSRCQPRAATSASTSQGARCQSPFL